MTSASIDSWRYQRQLVKLWLKHSFSYMNFPNWLQTDLTTTKIHSSDAVPATISTQMSFKLGSFLHLTRAFELCRGWMCYFLPFSRTPWINQLKYATKLSLKSDAWIHLLRVNPLWDPVCKCQMAEAPFKCCGFSLYFWQAKYFISARWNRRRTRSENKASPVVSPLPSSKEINFHSRLLCEIGLKTVEMVA